MKFDLGWLIGNNIERVTYDEQTLQWLFTIAGQASLTVACWWLRSKSRKTVARFPPGQKLNIS